MVQIKKQKQWMKPWWAHRVNETQTDPHSLAKATEH